jgi:hypothetical protein
MRHETTLPSSCRDVWFCIALGALLSWLVSAEALSKSPIIFSHFNWLSRNAVAFMSTRLVACGKVVEAVAIASSSVETTN